MEKKMPKNTESRFKSFLKYTAGFVCGIVAAPVVALYYAATPLLGSDTSLPLPNNTSFGRGLMHGALTGSGAIIEAIFGGPVGLVGGAVAGFTSGVVTTALASRSSNTTSTTPPTPTNSRALQQQRTLQRPGFRPPNLPTQQQQQTSPPRRLTTLFNSSETTTRNLTPSATPGSSRSQSQRK
jgi:hypothetical protein